MQQPIPLTKLFRPHQHLWGPIHVGVYHALPRSRGCDAQSVGFKPVVNKAVAFVVLAPGWHCTISTACTFASAVCCENSSRLNMDAVVGSSRFHKGCSMMHGMRRPLHTDIISADLIASNVPSRTCPYQSSMERSGRPYRSGGLGPLKGLDPNPSIFLACCIGVARWSSRVSSAFNIKD